MKKGDDAFWNPVFNAKNRYFFTVLPLKQAWRSVQWSIAVVYLMKAILAEAWAVTVPQGDDMVMG
jgi:hypothetical protein